MVFQRRWTKIGAGVSASVGSVFGLFFILVSVFGFEISSVDVVCGSTCFVPINITNPTRYNVDIYNPDQINLFFEGNVGEHYLFRKDGRCKGGKSCAAPNGVSLKGWNYIDFTEATKPRRDVAYTYRFRPYRTHEFGMWLKKAPSDTIKWTIELDGGFVVGNAELDPIIKGVLLRKDGGVAGDWSFGNLSFPAESVSCNAAGWCNHSLKVFNKLNVSGYGFAAFVFERGMINQSFVYRVVVENASCDTEGWLNQSRVCDFTLDSTGACWNNNITNSTNTTYWTGNCSSVQGSTCYFDFWGVNGSTDCNVTVKNRIAKSNFKKVSNSTHDVYFNKNGLLLNPGSGEEVEYWYKPNRGVRSGKFNGLFMVDSVDDWTCVRDGTCDYIGEVDPIFNASWSNCKPINFTCHHTECIETPMIFLFGQDSDINSSDGYPDAVRITINDSLLPEFQMHFRNWSGTSSQDDWGWLALPNFTNGTSDGYDVCYGNANASQANISDLVLARDDFEDRLESEEQWEIDKTYQTDVVKQNTSSVNGTANNAIINFSSSSNDYSCAYYFYDNATGTQANGFLEIENSGSAVFVLGNLDGPNNNCDQPGTEYCFQDGTWETTNTLQAVQWHSFVVRNDANGYDIIIDNNESVSDFGAQETADSVDLYGAMDGDRHDYFFCSAGHDLNLYDTLPTFTLGAEESAVNDTISPTIEIISPTNNTNTTDNTVTFTINTTDETTSTLDANVLCNGTSVGSNSSVANNTLTNITTSSLSDGLYFCWVTSFDGTNTNTSENLTIIVDTTAPSLSNCSFIALNSTNDVIGNGNAFNLLNIADIEGVRVTCSITDLIGVDANVSLFFIMNGTSACSLGNRQSETCHAWPEFIEFQEGVVTTLFDGAGNANQGDRINCSLVETSPGFNITCDIDEHYQNVWKHYPFDFTNFTFQNISSTRVKKNTIWCLNLPTTTIVPSNADVYKFDSRANTSVGGVPTEPELGFGCNNSYVSGNVQTSPDCALIASKLPEEFQDDGTKFRGLFTSALVSSLGTLDKLCVTTDSPTARYYSMKTYDYTGSGNILANISTNNGGSFTPLADGYETEININWFINTTTGNASQLIIKLGLNDTLGNRGNSSEFVLDWNLTVANFQPLVNIIVPEDESIVAGLSRINWTAADPNGDSLLINITLANSTNSTIIFENLIGSNDSVLFNFSTWAVGEYNLTVEACENETSIPLCGNDTHNVTITVNVSNFSLHVGVVQDVFDVNFSVIDWAALINPNINTGNYTWNLTQTNVSTFNATEFVFRTQNLVGGNINIFLSLNRSEEWYDWKCSETNISTSPTLLFSLVGFEVRDVNCSIDLKNASQEYSAWSVITDRADWDFEHTFTGNVT